MHYCFQFWVACNALRPLQKANPYPVDNKKGQPFVYIYQDLLVQKVGQLMLLVYKI